MKREFALAATLAALVLGAGSAQAGDGCFYGQDRFSIDYTLSGTESGTITEHVDACGVRRVEVKNTQVSVMGMVQRTDQRVIYDGEQIITVDNATGSVTTTTNPFYAQMAAAADREGGGVALGERMMRGMGGTPTGQTGSYAGHSCDRWQVAQLGAEVCVTSWGATLHMRSNIMGMTMERTATAVRLNDAGPADAYSYDASKAQATPNLGDIMRMMQGGQ